MCTGPPSKSALGYDLRQMLYVALTQGTLSVREVDFTTIRFIVFLEGRICFTHASYYLVRKRQWRRLFRTAMAQL